MKLQLLGCKFVLYGKALAKIMKENGWTLDRIKGRHHIFTKEGKRAIPVPIHGNKNLPKGLADSILKQAEIKGV